MTQVKPVSTRLLSLSNFVIILSYLFCAVFPSNEMNNIWCMYSHEFI